MGLPIPLFLALLAWLTLQTNARKHETVVLSQNESTTRQVFMDGATIMSEEFYRDDNSANTVLVVPDMLGLFLVNCRLMVKVVYMDLPKQQPCQDYIEICEATRPWNGVCLRTDVLLGPFCGALEDMFPNVQLKNRQHYMMTRSCTNIGIAFHTKKPSGNYRGFKFIITVFSSPGDCGSRRLFPCDDGRCINRDLHCDGISHCLDGSDENNCSREEGLVPITYCGPYDQNPLCRDRRWGERWFGLAIPMAIVMVLLFFAIAVKVRKQLCHPMPLGGSGRLHVAAHRRERAVQAPPIPQRPVIGPGWICPHEHLNDPALPPPEVDVGFTDAATLMLLPPPYSPPQDRPSNPYDPPTEGEPPPLYEDSLHHTLQSEKAVFVSPPSAVLTPGGTATHRPHPPAYQVLPPAVPPPPAATTASSSSSYTPSAVVITSSGEITLVPAATSALQRGAAAERCVQSSASPPPPSSEFPL